MTVRIHIDPSTAEQFNYYLINAISNDAKSIDVVKEYILARHLQSVLFKVEILLLKYKQQDLYRIKTILLSDLEILALNLYFDRYQVHNYLLPLQQTIMEVIRTKYPQLINVLTNKIQWLNFLEESPVAY